MIPLLKRRRKVFLIISQWDLTSKWSDLQYIRGGKYNHWILKHNEGIEKKDWSRSQRQSSKYASYAGVDKILKTTPG